MRREIRRWAVGVAVVTTLVAGGAYRLSAQSGTAKPPQENRVAKWSGAEMKALDASELTPQGKKAKSGVGAKTFMDIKTHKVMMSHREKTGVPELHTGETDIFVVQSGGGVLQIGGEMVDRKDFPGGATGSTIRGGERYPMTVGDVVNIPANVAHNWLLEPGQTVTYFIVKVEEPR